MDFAAPAAGQCFRHLHGFVCALHDGACFIEEGTPGVVSCTVLGLRSNNARLFSPTRKSAG